MVSLGLDLSTQSLSAVVIDTAAGKIIKENSINFAESFPEYKTENGFIRGENQEFYSYPELYLDALDKMMHGLADIAPDIDAISISGHQHASVYLNSDFDKAVAELDTNLSLNDQLKNSLCCITTKSLPFVTLILTGVETTRLETPEGDSPGIKLCFFKGYFNPFVTIP